MEKNNGRFWFLIICAAAVCILSALLSFCLGSINFTPKQIFAALIQGETGACVNILKYARLPRTIACLAAGAALSVAGAILQNVLSNNLASPGVIGVNAGAGLGVTLCCASGILSGWAVSASAFAGSVIATMIITIFAGRTGASKTTVVLGGVALNSILNAFRESVTTLRPDSAFMSSEFRVGGFSSVSYVRLLPAAALIAISLILLFTLFNELDVVALGDETAHSVGLSVRRYRIIFLILSASLAGAAVSFAGMLSFVGLIVPHLSRRVVGNESRRLIPFSALLGAGFLTLCDLAARMIFSPYELPVGIIMAIIGGPAFAFILIRRKGGRRHG